MRSTDLILPGLLALLLAAHATPAAAQAGGQVVCDVKVMRIVQAIRDKGDSMTPQEMDTARRALFKAVSECRPLRRSHGAQGPQPPAGESDERRRVEQGIQTDRQSLRLQQDTLTAPELREGERRIDAIERKAKTNPTIAREMQKIWQADESRATSSHGPRNQRLVGPGERR